ncbi:hypothetical protein SAMN05421874_111138 [Nonomuraea maritima]|uniref:IstB-like ATP-binding domain-containing protein n=2 Tax=Nonomuraea maritima TaxID=683260 RepID=A0A1G9EUM4_9ACTN|nr:hypothetical protein SAMN05421874_111138 [Nonomuraea maritima]
MLRLPTVRTQFPDLAEAAAREQMSYRDFLAELLMAVCDDRARRRSERRIKAAGFPREKSLRAFDFDANPNVDPAVINTLTTCDWAPIWRTHWRPGFRRPGGYGRCCAKAVAARGYGLVDHVSAIGSSPSPCGTGRRLSGGSIAR